LQAFISPETVFTQFVVPIGFYAKQVYSFRGDIRKIASSIKYDANSSQPENREFVVYLASNYDKSFIDPPITSIYSKRQILDSRKITNQSGILETSYLFKAPTFYRGFPSTPYIQAGYTGVFNVGSEGFNYIELDGLYNQPGSGIYSMYWDVAIHFHGKKDSIELGYTGDQDLEGYNADIFSESRRMITNIETGEKSQYGTIDIAKYIPVYYGKIDDSGTIGKIVVRNGDIFISRFAFRISTKFKFRIAELSVHPVFIIPFVPIWN